MGRYQVSERRAAMAARAHRPSLRYQSRRGCNAGAQSLCRSGVSFHGT